MYTEENQKEGRDFSLLKGFILRLILIVIFVLLLVKFVPWPDMSGLKSLQAQIFNNNITAMKEAAIPYFTTERLPKNVGDSVTLTLKEMLDLKLLVPFVDKDGNTCDLTKSYVKITKEENEYVLKVNLKCGSEEDYILVHVGCYSYCESTICEKVEEGKEEDKEPSSTSKPSTTTKPTSTAKPKPTSKPTTSPSPTTSPKPTTSPSPTASPKPTTSPSPTTSPKPTTSPSPTTSPKPTTSPSPVVNYEHEYKRIIPAVYSDWSGWKVWSYNDNDKINWTNTNTYQIEDLGAKKVQIGTRTNVAERYREVLKDLGTATYKVCAEYRYTADATKVYEIVSDWEWTDDYYEGYGMPKDTMRERWIFESVNVDYCAGTCTDNVYIKARKQVRKVKEYTQYSNITADCAKVEDRVITVQGVVNELYTYKTTEPVYGYKKFYRDRTRTLISPKKIQYTWNIYNNKTLLADGWAMTGNSRKK